MCGRRVDYWLSRIEPGLPRHQPNKRPAQELLARSRADRDTTGMPKRGLRVDRVRCECHGARTCLSKGWCCPSRGINAY